MLKETDLHNLAPPPMIRQFGDVLLRTKTIPVEKFDDRLVEQIKQMGVIMYQTDAVGLAANQLGLLNKVLIYRSDLAEESFHPLINPVIEWRSEEKETATEECLSIANVFVEVERATQIHVNALNMDGTSLTVKVEGYTARVVQHEIDHLNGVLIIDRCSKEQKREVMQKYLDTWLAI